MGIRMRTWSRADQRLDLDPTVLSQALLDEPSITHIDFYVCFVLLSFDGEFEIRVYPPLENDIG